PPLPPLFPYTTLFRSDDTGRIVSQLGRTPPLRTFPVVIADSYELPEREGVFGYYAKLVFEFSGNSTQVGDVTLYTTRDIAIERRSEEHTSELQSRENL